MIGFPAASNKWIRQGTVRVVPSSVIVIETASWDPRDHDDLDRLIGQIDASLPDGLPENTRAEQRRLVDNVTFDVVDPRSTEAIESMEAYFTELDARFGEWEEWVAAVHETHSSLPMLPLFRSHDAHQNWVTALGVLCDAAVHAQIIEGASDGSAYWFLRRADNLFRDMTEGVDLTRYVEDHADAVESGEREFFEPLYRELGDHGFDLLPYDEARRHAIEIRAVWAPRMEYLIDYLMCPRGFWSVPSEIVPSGRRQPRPSRTTEQMDEEHR